MTRTVFPLPHRCQRLCSNNRLMMASSFAASAMAMLSWISILTADEWPRFRGPHGSGLSSTSVPTRWTADDFDWVATIDGVGHSAPVIWQARVFVTSADPKTAEQMLFAIDAATGKTSWVHRSPLEAYPIHARNSFASNTPAVDAQHVYVAWATPESTTLTAFDHQGTLVWQKEFAGYRSSHGFGGSPLVHDDLVILSLLEKKPGARSSPAAPTSKIVACNRNTGELVWSPTLMSEVASYATPFVLDRPGKKPELICCSTAGGIFSLDLTSGSKNWSVPVFDKRTVSSPIYAGGLIMGTTGSGGGGNYVAAVQPGPNPELAYEIRQQAPYVPSLVAKDDLLFLWSDAGIVTCAEVETGQRIWTKRVGGNYSGSPVIAGSAIYCIDEDGTVVVLAADRTFKLLSKFELGEPSRSTPSIAGGKIYFRTESHVYALSSK